MNGELSISDIESRINAIERILYSDGINNDEKRLLSDEINTLIQQWNTYKSSNKNVEEYLNQYQKIEQFIQKSKSNDIPRDVKINIILSHAEMIKSLISKYKQFNELKSYIDSKEIQNLIHKGQEIQKASFDHIIQKQSIKEQDEKIKQLLLQYNQIMNYISELFVKWDIQLDE